MSKKTKEPVQKTNVRKMKLSLKLKLTFLVSFMLIITVAVVTVFTIQKQNELLDQELDSSAQTYLNGLSEVLTSTLLQGTEERELSVLQDYVEKLHSYIKNSKMVMFVDYSGKIISHSVSENIGGIISKTNYSIFTNTFSEDVYDFPKFGTNNTDVFTAEVTNRSKEWVTNISEEESLVYDESGSAETVTEYTTNVSYETVFDIQTAKITNINGSETNIETLKGTNSEPWVNSDYILPVYVNRVPQSVIGYALYEDIQWQIDEIGDYYDAFSEGTLFPTKNVLRSNEKFVVPFDKEIRHDYEFKAAFQEIYYELITGSVPSEKTYDLAKNGVLTWPEYGHLVNINKYTLNKFGSTTNRSISDEDFELALQILSKLGMTETEIQKFEKWRKRKFFGASLFREASEVSADQKAAESFVGFVETFLSYYWDSEELAPTKNMSNYMEKLAEEVNINNWKWIDEDHYKSYLIELQNLYDTKLIPYLSGASLTESDVNEVFKCMYSLFRIGTVRVIINRDKLNLERYEIRQNTIDIATVIILRMIFITLILVILMIAPINTLSRETEKISEHLDEVKVDASLEEFTESMGDLKKYLRHSIVVKQSDELGVLADRFNLMTMKFSETFDEIERKQGELDLAQKIQEALLPKSLPEIPGFEFSVYYEPQSESGGDYYDFIDIDENNYEKRFGFVVADVTNHGVGAAMVMASLRSSIRTFARKTKDAKKVIQSLNPVLLRDTPSNMFATVFYAVVENSGEETALYYSIAGHEEAFVYNTESKKMVLLQRGGMPVGVVPSAMFDAQIKLFKYVFKKGDILIQYSDGITEAKNSESEEYEEERFQKAIIESADKPIDELRDAIIADVVNFRGEHPQSDDITMLIIKYNG